MVDIVVGFIPPQFKLSSPSEARAGDVARPARRTDARRSDSDRDVARGLSASNASGLHRRFLPLRRPGRFCGFSLELFLDWTLRVDLSRSRSRAVALSSSATLPRSTTP